MTHDVALLHGWDEAIIEMKVGTADAGAGDSHNGIAGIEDGRIRNGLHAHFFDTHITNSFHAILLFAAKTSLRLNPERTGRAGSATLITPVMKSRGPCDWPSIVGISPASMSAARRRRSWRTAKLAPLLRNFAGPPMPGTEPYWIRALIRVPRSRGAC